MIDRYLIRYFLAVVDLGTFSRAADRMSVTQPTLSAGIAKLEKLLGAQLFHRTSRRVHLTDAGTRFLPHARQIESEFNRALASVTGLQAGSMIRIGVLNTISSTLVANAVRQLMSKEGGVRIEIVDGAERELVNHLARRRVDVALTLVARGGDRFEEDNLFDEGYGVAMPSSHPMAGKGELQAEDLADSVMIVRRHCEALSETSRYFTERGVRPFFAYRSDQDDRVLAMISSGLGLTVMPDHHHHDGVLRSRLSGFGHRRQIGFLHPDIASRETLEADSGFQAFREAVLQFAKVERME